MLKTLKNSKLLRIWIFLVFLAVLRWKLHISIEGLIFWSFIIILFYKKWDSRISIGLALACLVTLPVLLSLFNYRILLMGDIWAERVAVWAFYFLSIGVMKQIVEFRVDQNSKFEDSAENSAERGLHVSGSTGDSKPAKYYEPIQELPAVAKPRVASEKLKVESRVMGKKAEDTKIKKTRKPRVLKLAPKGKNVLVIKKTRVRRVAIKHVED